MQYKNDGMGESNVLQNTFTSYLTTAVRRERCLYLKRKRTHEAVELTVDIETYFDNLMTLDLETYCELREEIAETLKAIDNLQERERWVFLQRVLKDQDYKAIGKELGVSYFGAATIFSRAMKRLKEELKE